MDEPVSHLPSECLALIRELFTKDIVDTYDGEFGVGGYGFITNRAEHGVRPLLVTG